MSLTCATALERLLEADLAELRAGGAHDSELGRHLRDCPRCRAAAARVVEAEDALGRALGGVAPRRAPGDAVQAAIRLAARRAHRRRWLWRAGPLAAAAALAALLLGRREPTPLAPLPAAQPPGASFEVQAAAGRSVAVFHTDNPDIVVIWFF